MHGAAMDRESLISRFWAYLRERYDPVQFVPFHLLTVAAVGGLVRLRFDAPADAAHVLSHGALTLILLAFYFILRVFDEHKDWEDDIRAHPDRLLSRGVIEHRHLRWAAWGAVAVMIGLSLPFGLAMVAGTVAILGYALLMLREFFAAAWLRQRVVLYGLTHNAVVFLSVHLVFLGFGLVAGEGLATLRDPFVHAGALAINLLVFSLEVARKIRTPDGEREGVETYSRVLGLRKAAVLLLGVQSAGAAALLFLLFTSEAHLMWVRAGLMVVGWGLTCAAIRALLNRPTTRAAERLVQPAGLSVALYLIGTAI